MGPRQVNCVVLTGFEPAISTLRGWRPLQTGLQDFVNNL